MLQVKTKKDVPASTVVSKGWLENAINHHEGVNNSSVTKMDFCETKQVNRTVEIVELSSVIIRVFTELLSRPRLTERIKLTTGPSKLRDNMKTRRPSSAQTSGRGLVGKGMGNF